MKAHFVRCDIRETITLETSDKSTFAVMCTLCGNRDVALAGNFHFSGSRSAESLRQPSHSFRIMMNTVIGSKFQEAKFLFAFGDVELMR